MNPIQAPFQRVYIQSFWVVHHPMPSTFSEGFAHNSLGGACNPHAIPWGSCATPSKPFFREICMQPLGVAHNPHASHLSEVFTCNPEGFCATPCNSSAVAHNPRVTLMQTLFRGVNTQPPFVRLGESPFEFLGHVITMYAPSGEEHWTKVLQANEVNSNVIVIPCHSTKKQALHHLCQQEGRTCRSRRGSDARRASTSSIRTLGTDSLASTHKESNFFSNLYARFCQWISSSRGEGSISLSRTPSSGRRTPRSTCRSRSSSLSSNKSQADLIQQLLAQMPAECHENSFIHSLSSEDSEFSSLHHRASYSSTCSSLTITSNSTATSDCQTAWGDSLTPQGHFGSSGMYANALNPNYSTLDPSNNKSLLSVWDRRHTNLTFTISCPLKTKHPSVSIQTESIQDSRSSLCATWPPTGRKNYGK